MARAVQATRAARRRRSAGRRRPPGTLAGSRRWISGATGEHEGVDVERLEPISSRSRLRPDRWSAPPMSDDPTGSELSAAGAPPEWFKAALDSMIDLVGIRRAVRDDAGSIVDFEIVYTNAASHGAVEVAEDRPVGSRLTD